LVTVKVIFVKTWQSPVRFRLQYPGKADENSCFNRLNMQTGYAAFFIDITSHEKSDFSGNKMFLSVHTLKDLLTRCFNYSESRIAFTLNLSL
jgi:hypothetical protein